MFTKSALSFCFLAIFIHSSLSQCCGRNAGYSAGTGTGYGYGGAGCNTGITASGGGFPISSSSSINPAGLAVESSNRIEGCLASNGKLPFITAVGVEGQLPTAGDAATNYCCGGNIGIQAAGGYGSYGPGYGAGYGASYGGYGAGCGCGGGGAY